MFSFLTRSIPRKILAALIAIYVTTYAATAGVVYSSVYTSILETNTNALGQLAQRKFERIDGIFEALATDVIAWSRLEVMNDLASNDIDKRVASTLEELKQLYGLQGDIYAFDGNNKLVASTDSERAIRTLPAVWHTDTKTLTLIAKHPDPLSSRSIVAMTIPVFGTFDRSFRIGQLVLTYPWSTIEGFLSSGDAGIVLVAGEDKTHPLAVRLEPLGQLRHGTYEDLWPPRTDERLVVGQSAPATGILNTWRVYAVQKASLVAQSLRRVGAELLLLGLALSVPMIALGRWLSRRLSAPIIELTRIVSEIADTDKLDARVPISATDEFGLLARSFNRMTESLECATKDREQVVRDLEALNLTLESKVAERTKELEIAIAAQQRLIGDISHEIKSPLARLGMALGLLRRGGSENSNIKHFDRIEREIENISELASELLTLVKLDSAAEAIEFDPVDLCALVRQIIDDALYETPARSSDVRRHIPASGVFVNGDRDLLARAIENVVRNALFYTVGKTPVEVTVSSKDARAVVEVRDRGPGVPEAALAHLFEPFYRVDEARARNTGGAGVGLAICQRVVALHRGYVHARANHPSGLIVHIELPTCQQNLATAR